MIRLSCRKRLQSWISSGYGKERSGDADMEGGERQARADSDCSGVARISRETEGSHPITSAVVVGRWWVTSSDATSQSPQPTARPIGTAIRLPDVKSKSGGFRGQHIPTAGWQLALGT